MSLPRLRAMAAVLAASIAVAIVNPNGWDIYLYPFQTGGSPEQQRLIVEWFSPNFQMSQIWAFEAMIFLLIGGLALARRIRVLAVVAVASLPSWLQRIDGKLVARDFPIKAADFLVQHPAPGHMLNVYGWGGYLIFRLDGHVPAQPVFIFGDAALAGDRLLRDYDHLQSLGQDQAQLLERYQINWVIFHSTDPIVTELRQIHNAPGQTGWFELGTFDKATIMMRDTPANRAYAAASTQ